MRNEFLAAMSRELRTRLTATRGDAELMALEILNPVNDILEISRTEAGQLGYDIGPVALPQVVDGTAEKILPQANAGGLRLVVEQAPGRPVSRAPIARRSTSSC